ncbi:MAG: MotA/TolQ/ExbB proton channel family protein [Alteromonadaceae bacterium]|nr:MotA/TolQ/ExbB proton channel family protein [Alteromonadaceae bacterium]
MVNKIYLWLFIALLSLSITAIAQAENAQAISKVEAQLVKNISQAQQALTEVENQILNERSNIAKQLAKLERAVIKLRKETSVTRRLADEKTLSFTKLEQRLSTWKQQQVFQQNLLHRFLQHHQSKEKSPAATKITEQFSRVLAKSKQLNQSFAPQWQEGNVVLPNGEISQKPILTVGPVTWYWDEMSNQAGFASHRDHNLWQHNGFLPNSNSIENLRSSAVGTIVFDPTLRRALARSQHQESIVEHVIKGGLWVIPILLFGLFSLVIALIKIVQFWRLPRFVQLNQSMLNKILSTQVEPLVVATKIRGMQKTLLEIGRKSTSATQRDDELFMELQDNKRHLERRLSAIAITAAVAPLLGLLGTVSGMIETFRMMTLFGSGDAEVVSGGISQALVTTELGLVVAIPALILNAVLSRKAKAYYSELENFAILLSNANEQPHTPDVISDVLASKPERIQGIAS